MTCSLRVPSFVCLVGCLVATSALAVEQPQYLGPTPKGPEKLKRIVTLAPSLTETVLELGERERLVGVSRFDEFPEVKSVRRVGGFIDPSIEAVIALRPDLVLVQPAPGNQRPVEKLAELGVPVLALPMHTIGQTLQSIREVGRVLGRPEKAEEIVRRIEATREQARRRAVDRPKLRVLFVYDFEPLVVAGPGSFADELLRDVGAKNAAEKADTPYPVYPVEAVLAAKPDVIIDSDHDPHGADKLRRLAKLKDARWIRLPSEDLMHPGPNLGRGLEHLARALYPD